MKRNVDSCIMVSYSRKMRLFSVSVCSLLLLGSLAITINHFSIVAAGAPSPQVSATIDNPVIYQGESFTLQVNAHNTGTKGNGWISVSLPDVVDSSVVVSMSSSWGTENIWIPGSELRGCYGQCELAARYLLVESNGSWGAQGDPSASQSMTVTIQPKHVGIFTIFYRATIFDNESLSCRLFKTRDCYHHDPPPDDLVDQQEEYVNKEQVLVLNPFPEKEPRVSSGIPEFVEKSKPYIFRFDFFNPGNSDFDVDLIIKEYEVGDPTGFHFRREYDAFASVPALGKQTSEVAVDAKNWVWADDPGILDFLQFGGEELADAATDYAKNHPIKAKRLAQHLGADPGVGWKTLQKAAKVGSAVLVVLDVIEAYIQLKKIDAEKVYVYELTDTTSYLGGSSRIDIVDGIPPVAITTAEVPPWKHGLLIGLILAVPAAGLCSLIPLLGWAAEALIGLGSLIARDILADDPPDLVKYKEPVDPDLYQVVLDCDPGVDGLSRAMKSICESGKEMAQYLKATQVTYERLQGAIEMEDTAAITLQYGKMNEFAKVVDENILAMDKEMDIVVDELDARGVVITADDIRDFKDSIRINGLPPEERQVFLDMGYSPREFEEFLLNLNDDWLFDYHNLQSFGLLAPIVPYRFTEGSVGVEIPEIPDPRADACGPYVGYEGEAIQFTASCSDIGWGTIVGYEWDFDGDGAPDSFESDPTYVWYDNVEETVTLTLTVLFYVEVETPQGEAVLVPVIRTASTSFGVTILNVDPKPSISSAYMLVDFTLRVAGEKWHDVSWTLYNSTDNITWDEVAHLWVRRYPGSPNVQSQTVYDVFVDMTRYYKFVATYDPYDDPVNGQIQGSTPIWIDLTFEDGSTERIHHNFNVEQSTFRDTDRWIHCEAWCIDLSPWLVGHWFNLEANITDVGTDDLTLEWNYRDMSGETNTTLHTYRLNGQIDPPDPPGSPYDREDGPYPMHVQVVHYTDYNYKDPSIREAAVMHSYDYENDFAVTLTATDDDGGHASYTIQVKAIHTDHVCPVR